MKIGHAAAASGMSAKMIRHYEAIGLLRRAARSGANYRDFADGDVAKLAFIRRSRALGFSLDRIRDLLRLWSDGRRSSAEVKQIALDHLKELDGKIADLRAMAATLHGLVAACEGGAGPDCPIIESLEGARPSQLRGVPPDNNGISLI